jgi:hypothetical protein
LRTSSRLLLTALVLIVGPAAAFSKPRSGVVSTDFDGKPVGARYIGMGETGAALAGSPASPVWNPAALQDLPGAVFSADFDVARESSLSEDILLKASPLRGRKLTYLGFAGPSTAFFFRPLASFREKTVTDPADPANNFTETSFKVNQFGFSATDESEEGRVLGITLSYLNARRGFARAKTGEPPQLILADGNGFSLDAGLRVQNDTFSAGWAFFNIPGILYWNAYRPDQLPVLTRAGVAYHPVKAFTFSSDYEKRFYRGGLEKPEFIHLGMEWGFFPWLKLRGGTFGEDLGDRDETFYTGGFSVASARSHQVDVSFRTYRVEWERVYNYFLSIILPLPSGAIEDRPAAPRKEPLGPNFGL